jgi:hypothetical protein
VEVGLEPQQAGALQRIAAALVQRFPGPLQRLPGGAQPVVEAQRIGQAAKGAGAQIAAQAGRVGGRAVRS